jgi:glyoxylase-like metal-dependent hydrolase (beta-lactamase superfamily II)
VVEYLQLLAVPTTLPEGPTNTYLVTSDPITLIDTGPRDNQAEPALRAMLAERGLTFGNIGRIVVTHAHIDHFGLAGQIIRESRAKLYTHARNYYWLTEYHIEWARRFGYYAELLARFGAPRGAIDGMIDGISALMPRATSIPEDAFIPLGDGQVIRLNGDDWQIIHAPGHASGMIVLYEGKSKTLLSSDHILRDITSNPILEPPARGETERPRSLPDYIQSLQKIARLEVGVALPAHGEPVYDVGALIEGRLAFHRKRKERIASVLSEPLTPYEIALMIFPNLKQMDIFLGLSEVVGHLDLLEDEGRAAHFDSNGVTRYTIAEAKS